MDAGGPRRRRRRKSRRRCGPEAAEAPYAADGFERVELAALTELQVRAARHCSWNTFHYFLQHVPLLLKHVPLHVAACSVACCFLHVAWYASHIVRCTLLAMLHVSACILSAVCCLLLPVACCPLRAACCVLQAARLFAPQLCKLDEPWESRRFSRTVRSPPQTLNPPLPQSIGARRCLCPRASAPAL
jgi:hypothetical protein